MARAWDIVALVDTEGCEIYCPECGDQQHHHPIFVDNEYDLEDGTVCPECECRWVQEDGEWVPPDPDADQVLREVCFGQEEICRGR